MAQVYPQMNESSHRETGVHLRTPAHMPYSNNVPLPGHPSPEYDRTQVPAGPPRSMARQPHTFHITFPLAPPLVLATSRHISRSNDDRPTAPRSKLQYKDLRYDGKSNWKAFFHKFVRLSRNYQSASTNNGDSLREWAYRVLTLATRAFPQLPTSTLRPSPAYAMVQMLTLAFLLWTVAQRRLRKR